MEKSDLIEYLRVIINTEAGLYASRRILSELANAKDSIKCPSCPVEPKKPAANTLPTWSKLFSALFAFFGLTISVANLDSSDSYLIILGAFFICISIIILFSAIRVKKKRDEEDNQIYQTKYNTYLRNKKAYDEAVNRKIEAERIYETIFKKINVKIEEFQQTLSLLYSQNIIYPKYQNWVCCCSFLEYFESGRCETLEGTNGAYNLYEAEKRQNIIISALDDITANIEAIKYAQFELFNSLLASQNQITNVLNNIHEQQVISSFERSMDAQLIAASIYLSK